MMRFALDTFHCKKEVRRDVERKRKETGKDFGLRPHLLTSSVSPCGIKPLCPWIYFILKEILSTAKFWKRSCKFALIQCEEIPACSLIQLKDMRASLPLVSARLLSTLYGYCQHTLCSRYGVLQPLSGPQLLSCSPFYTPSSPKLPQTNCCLLSFQLCFDFPCLTGFAIHNQQMCKKVTISMFPMSAPLSETHRQALLLSSVFK